MKILIFQVFWDFSVRFFQREIKFLLSNVLRILNTLYILYLNSQVEVNILKLKLIFSS
jgi:hypothetical protein